MEQQVITQSNNAKPVINTRYYRYVNDKLIQIRLMRVKNDNCYVVEANGQRFNMTKAEFKTYEKLRPDGYVSFAVAQLEDGFKDVIVGFYRKEDFTSSTPLPFAACRMNVYDMYTNAINKDKNIMYISCSVNQDSCPADMKFKLMFACNGMESTEFVATYIEDTLEDILKPVNTLPYDDVLYILDKGYDKTKVSGSCPTLKQMLVQDRFIDDVYYGFKELKVQFKYIAEVALELTHAIEDIIKRQMINPVWTKFDRDIDLSKIEDEYIIIRDIDDDLFIVSYKKGEYVNRPYFASGDTTEYDVLKELAQTNK